MADPTSRNTNGLNNSAFESEKYSDSHGGGGDGVTANKQNSTPDYTQASLKDPGDTTASTISEEKRQQWGRKIQFILACVGYAVGLGNVWRFPYLCYKSGGGAFLIPYFLMLTLCGVPLLLMELSVGQYFRLGPVGAFKKLCPLLKGTGAATVMITFLLTTYYNVIIAWALFYFIASFQEELPWNKCNQTWNTADCFSHEDFINLGPNDVKPNNTVASTQEYYDYRVLDISTGIDDPGGIRGELVGLLAVAWVLVYLCLFKGVASSGKVVYLTATFPYVVLTVLLINGAMLEGAIDGIKFFLFPEWEKLLDANVWVAAAAQNFNSIGIAFGSMIALSSYNGFHSDTLFRDTFIISCLNSLTSLFASFVIFSVIGYIAYVQDAPIESVVTDGPGLVFVVYPAAFDTMPVPQLWSALFFFMLICLGIDSQFAMVEVVVSTFEDGFPSLRKLYFNRKEILVAYICIITFLLGLPNVTRGGIYYFQLMDWYTAVVSLFFIAICEVAAISWFYGANRLGRNIREMVGSYPNIIIRGLWYVVSPVLIVAIMIFNIVDFQAVTYGDYVYPSWAEGFGWFFACLSIVWIPIGVIHTLASGQGSIKERFLTSIKSEINEATYAQEIGLPATNLPLTVITCEFPPPYDEAMAGHNQQTMSMN